MRRAVRALAVVAAIGVSVAGCERIARNMYRQPYDRPQSTTPVFPDGSASRPPPSGSEPARAGPFAGTSGGRRGADTLERDRQALAAREIPYPLNDRLLARGRERYAIFCLPCHSPLGDGDGYVARRGFPHPPSYHLERLRAAPDRHFFDVITDGYGVMYSYGERIPPTDRWAIVAYVRALQRSQNATLADVPRDERERLEREAGP